MGSEVAGDALGVDGPGLTHRFASFVRISERCGRDELPAILAEARAVFPSAHLPGGWDK
jgi:hypothetical protein